VAEVAVEAVQRPRRSWSTRPPPAPTAPDFSEVDASFQAFIDERTDFDGISYVLVDADGIIHQEVFGDHTDDTVVLLASTSKVPGGDDTDGTARRRQR
jgi:hypothetical protein